MQPSRPNGQVRNAFTLIELMIVVLLIGVMAAVVIPEMKGSFNDALLRSVSREVMDACNLAWSRSVSFNQPHRLRLDLQSGKYAVEKRVRIQGQDAFVPLRDVSGGTGTLDSRIKIQFHRPDETLPTSSGEPAFPDASDRSPAPAQPTIIGFYPDGTADAGELVLRDRDGFRLALRINPTTARVRVAELERATVAAAEPGEGL